MYFIGWLAFMIFGESEVREWAKIDTETDKIDPDQVPVYFIQPLTLIIIFLHLLILPQVN